MVKKISFYLLCILFALLPFNALLTNWVNFGLHISLPVNAWKEIIVVLISLLAVIDYCITRKKIVLEALDWILLLLFGVAVIVILLQPWELGRIIFGLKYGFEFLWLFFLLRHTSWFTEKEVERLLFVALTSAAVVIVFGILEIFILPPDFLLLFGYSPNVSTWVPGGPLPVYHAADLNNAIPRLASTLSGPNQFSTYLLVVGFLFGAFFLSAKKMAAKISWGLLSLLAVICLFFTYSRSAYGAFFIAALIGAFILVRNKKLFMKIAAGVVALGIVVTGTLFFLRPGIFQYVLVRASSTQGHVERSWDALVYTLQVPFGHGIGAAGPASTRFNGDDIGWISENWYLQVGLEMGIIGMLLYTAFLIFLLHSFWITYQSGKDLRLLALFLSLLAIGLTSFFLHSWEESAAALTFWGLAGLLLRPAAPKATIESQAKVS